MHETSGYHAFQGICEMSRIWPTKAQGLPPYTHRAVFASYWQTAHCIERMPPRGSISPLVMQSLVLGMPLCDPASRFFSIYLYGQGCRLSPSSRYERFCQLLATAHERGREAQHPFRLVVMLVRTRDDLIGFFLERSRITQSLYIFIWERIWRTCESHIERLAGSRDRSS